VGWGVSVGEGVAVGWAKLRMLQAIMVTNTAIAITIKVKRLVFIVPSYMILQCHLAQSGRTQYPYAESETENAWKFPLNARR